MKTQILTIITSLILALPAFAAEDHDHAKKEAGPNGGKVLTTIEPHAEFFVTTDRKVQITFLNKDGKAIAWRSALANKLISLQQGDGNWVNTSGKWMESDPDLVTSYVLMSLGYLQQDL